MDEFANELRMTSDKILAGPCSNLLLTIIPQNIAQLKALFEKQESILGNCDEMFLLEETKPAHKLISESALLKIHD